MATACWTFADLFEAVAIAIPDAPALCRGDVTMNWRQFNDEADALASFLIAHGVDPHATLGIYAGNLPEHLVGYFAASKASIVRLTSITATLPTKSMRCSTMPTRKRCCSMQLMPRFLILSATVCLRCDAGSRFRPLAMPCRGGRMIIISW